MAAAGRRPHRATADADESPSSPRSRRSAASQSAAPPGIRSDLTFEPIGRLASGPGRPALALSASLVASRLRSTDERISTPGSTSAIISGFASSRGNRIVRLRPSFAAPSPRTSTVKLSSPKRRRVSRPAPAGAGREARSRARSRSSPGSHAREQDADAGAPSRVPCRPQRA